MGDMFKYEPAVPATTERGMLQPGVLDLFQQLIGQLPTGAATPYGQPLVAGLGPMEQQILGQVGQMGVTTPEMGAGQALLSQILGGQFLDPARLAPQAGEIQRRVQEQVGMGQTNILGQAQAFGMAGASPHLAAAGQLERAGAADLAGSLTQLYGGQYAMERGLQQQALGMIPSLAMAPVQRAGAMMGLAGMPRGIEQAGLTADYQEFLRQQDPTGFQQLVAQLTMGMPTRATGVGETPAQMGWGYQIPGAIAGGLDIMTGIKGLK